MVYIDCKNVTLSYEGREVVSGLTFQIEKGDYLCIVGENDTAEFAYKCTDFYHPNDEGGLAYNDPDIGVQWPIPEDMELILSDKDQKWGSFKEYTANRGKKD